MEHKAVLVHSYGVEDPAEACQIGLVKTPKPTEKQVLIKMLCRPINPSDVLCVRGQYKSGPSTFPFVPGFEGMGKIEEVGKGVTGLRVGQRVYCSFQSGGSWQEYALADAESLIPVPDEVSNEVAAQFFINPWTAYGMLDDLKVPKGEYVLQTGAASVLGRMFIQLAHYQGIKTINLVRRNEQKDELKSLGADEVINFKEEDVVERVKSITGGKLAYGAVDCVAGEITKLVCSCVRDDGTILIYGVMGGSDAHVPVSDITHRDIKVRGFHLSKWVLRFKNPAEEFPKVAAKIMDLLVKGVITPLTGQKFKLEDVKEAITHSQSGARGGKVLLVSD